MQAGSAVVRPEFALRVHPRRPEALTYACDKPEGTKCWAGPFGDCKYPNTNIRMRNVHPLARNPPHCHTAHSANIVVTGDREAVQITWFACGTPRKV